MLIGVYRMSIQFSNSGEGELTPGGMVQSLYLSALYGAIRGRRAVTPYERLQAVSIRHDHTEGEIIPNSLQHHASLSSR